ncbi:MAG: hypothetical protein WAU36_10895 [Cyclobacteriaceae bacterium]
MNPSQETNSLIPRSVVSIQKISRVFVAITFLSTSIYLPIQNVIINVAQLSIVLLFLMLILLRRLVLHKEITVFLFIYFLISLAVAFYNEFSYQNIAVSYLALNLYASVLASVFVLHNGNIRALIELYLGLALAASILAIFQEFSYLIGFEIGYNLKWIFNGYANPTYSGPFLKVASFFTEPGYFAPFLIPASYISMRSLVFKSGDISRIGAIIILFALIITFSLIGYLGLFICIIILFRKNLMIGVSLSLLFVFYVALNSQSIKPRLETVYDFFNGQVTTSSNFSALIVILNYNLTVEGIKRYPLFGAGIDGYEMVSRRMIEHGIGNEAINKIIQNYDSDILMIKDGGNLFFRLIIEFGIIGVILIVLFFWKNTSYISAEKQIQFACLIFLVTYAMRTGQYLRFEVWFFIMLFLKVKGSNVQQESRIDQKI